MVVDVATALVYLHTECEERIIHRDVKAANVMLDAKFNARLGDFGLARSYNHSLLTPESTNVAGTFGYFAPELFDTGNSFSFHLFFFLIYCEYHEHVSHMDIDFCSIVMYVHFLNGFLGKYV